MNKEVYLQEINNLDQKIANLKEEKENLKAAYLKEQRLFADGDTVHSVTEKDDDIGIVRNAVITESGSIKYNLNRIRKDGSQSTRQIRQYGKQISITKA